MQFTIATTLFIFTLASASPLAFPQNAGSGSGASNTCGASSFNPITGTGKAPTLDNCYKLRDSTQGSGPWKIDGPKTLATFGDCAFSASPVTSGQAGYIGKDDLSDLVQDAIQKWQQGSTTSVKGTITKQVGTNGDMPCDTQGGTQVQIAWTLGYA